MYGFDFNTPIGIINLTADDNELKTVEIRNNNTINKEIIYNDGVNNERINEAIHFLNHYFQYKISIKNKEIPKGTEFQMKVWDCLTKINFGEKMTYMNFSEKYFDKKAIRAVASAIGKNPWAIIIPCHRIIGSDHKMHGYAWGIDKKISLLEHEGLLSLGLF
jgi:methylated-DNA-[protein]-cysteine S-methyltransferase